MAVGERVRNGPPLKAATSFSQLGTELHEVPMALDGELFLGRGRFQECMSIVRSSSTNLQKWSEVKYMVFDAPEVAAPAGDRLRTALIALDGNPWAEVLEHVICTDAEHLTRAMDNTIARLSVERVSC